MRAAGEKTDLDPISEIRLRIVCFFLLLMYCLSGRRAAAASVLLPTPAAYREVKVAAGSFGSGNRNCAVWLAGVGGALGGGGGWTSLSGTLCVNIAELHRRQGSVKTLSRVSVVPARVVEVRVRFATEQPGNGETWIAFLRRLKCSSDLARDGT